MHTERSRKVKMLHSRRTIPISYEGKTDSFPSGPRDPSAQWESGLPGFHPTGKPVIAEPAAEGWNSRSEHFLTLHILCPEAKTRNAACSSPGIPTLPSATLHRDLIQIG